MDDFKKDFIEKYSSEEYAEVERVNQWCDKNGIVVNPDALKSLRKDFEELAFERYYLCEFVPHCAVQDREGNHCNGQATHEIENNGKKAGLCDLCYKSYYNGCFENRGKFRIK